MKLIHISALSRFSKLALTAALALSWASAQTPQVDQQVTQQTAQVNLTERSVPNDRSGVQIGGIPPFFVSVGVYTTLADYGQNRLEGRVLGSYAYIPTFNSGYGVEADLLLSAPISSAADSWRIYGGPAVGVANINIGESKTYYGVGGLIGIRNGSGLGLFAEVGGATFFDGITGPFARVGLKYSF